jgi:hypothetical protein
MPNKLSSATPCSFRIHALAGVVVAPATASVYPLATSAKGAKYLHYLSVTIPQKYKHRSIKNEHLLIHIRNNLRSIRRRIPPVPLQIRHNTKHTHQMYTCTFHTTVCISCESLIESSRGVGICEDFVAFSSK